jgi:Mrp family chromosome partitioning ATPase
MLEPHAAAGIALAVAAATVGGLCSYAVWRKPHGVRSEKELVDALGSPMVAARPLAAAPLAEQLAAHWFRRGRRVLAVVSAEERAARARVAAELARALAGCGEQTLLIDADFRKPALHRAFGLENREGLAAFLEGRELRLAHCAENLSVLVAGRCASDPLELLSRERMRALLAAAARRYGVVLVHTPPAVRGPDLQLPAAFAGGALVVTRFRAAPQPLERLRELLSFCGARVVGAVLSPA